jgi:hypothetical protein
MRSRVQRWTSLALCSVLCGGLSLVALAGAENGAGADPPALTASPTSVNYGTVTLGNHSVLHFTVTNSSASPDVITGYGNAGPNADSFNASPGPDCTVNDAFPVTVPAGGSCEILVAFFPSVLGPLSTTVTLTDQDASGVSVPLSGTGAIGYYQVNAGGKVAHYGDAAFYGDLSGSPLNKPIVGIAPSGSNAGYWLVASDGGIFNFGSAGFFGSAGGINLNKPIVGIAPTVDNAGYWLVATDGGIFSYGDAKCYDSTGSIALNKPVVGMAATPDGKGYWLVASDGGIFAYGDATFFGSTGSIHLNKPVVGMAATPDGGGYWLVASDGGIFAYGDATFFGSTGSIQLNQPIVAMAVMPTGKGYWFTAADGGLFNYGDAPFLGATAGKGFGTVVGMATDGEPTRQASAS